MSIGPIPIPTSCDGPAPAASGTARGARSSADVSAWKAACRQALGEGFDGWFQPPPPNRAAQPTDTQASGTAPQPQTAAAMLARWSAAGASDQQAQGDATAPDETHATAAARVAGSSANPVRAATTSSEYATAALAGFISAWLAGPVAIAATLPIDAAQAAEAREPAQATTAVGAADVDVEASPTSKALPVSTDEQAADASTETSDARRPGAAAQEREPVRMYAEWTDAGVRVWLGVDAAGMSLMPALAREMQDRLRAQGTRLIGLVCNGQELALRDPSGATAADPPEFATEPDPRRAAEPVTSHLLSAFNREIP